MTVYARGYRPYEGDYDARAPAIAIALEGVGRVWRSKAFKRIGALYVVWFVICAFLLYMLLYLPIGMAANMFGRALAMADTPEIFTVLVLNEVLRIFYVGMAFVTALLAIFVGSGLVADDLSTGALPLYLVRPLRAVDYALGKALIVPMILLGTVLLPGLLLYLICGLWQPPGHSWDFLIEHLEIPARVLEHFLLASAAYTGLALLLSSRTDRRTGAAVLLAVVIFAGVLLQGVGLEEEMQGVVGDAIRLAGLPLDTRVAFEKATRIIPQHTQTRNLPSLASVRVLAGALLFVGLYFTWRRARSVEITS